MKHHFDIEKYVENPVYNKWNIKLYTLPILNNLYNINDKGHFIDGKASWDALLQWIKLYL